MTARTEAAPSRRARPAPSPAWRKLLLRRGVWIALLLSLANLTASTVSAQQFARRAGDVRNEEALEARKRTLSRLLMHQTRNLATVDTGSGEIVLHTAKVEANDTDFEQLEQMAPGQVQQLVRAGATKLVTDHDLHFEGGKLETENVSADYPGVYSVWLKRTGSGWGLLFNREPDIWGTQRDPKMDVLEIKAEHAISVDPVSELTPALSFADGRGNLELRWGTHRWSAEFTLD